MIILARKFHIWAILLLMVWAMGFTVAAQSAKLIWVL
jgi:hypothetical protein